VGQPAPVGAKSPIFNW